MRVLSSLFFATVAGISALDLVASSESYAHMSEVSAATLVKHEGSGMERREWDAITVELRPGTGDAWRFNSGNEIVYVLEGAGRLEVRGKPSVPLNPGSIVTLDSPPDYVLKNTSPTQILKVLVVHEVEKGQPHSLRADRRTRPHRSDEAPISHGESRRHKIEQPNKSSEAGLVFCRPLILCG